jgi:hypothetical protein
LETAEEWRALGAEAQGFDALVTNDKNLSFQQNLRGRKLAIVVLPTNLGAKSWIARRWPSIRSAEFWQASAL